MLQTRKVTQSESESVENVLASRYTYLYLDFNKKWVWPKLEMVQTEALFQLHLSLETYVLAMQSIV